jgi:hypothetical protein
VDVPVWPIGATGGLAGRDRQVLRGRSKMNNNVNEERKASIAIAVFLSVKLYYLETITG